MPLRRFVAAAVAVVWCAPSAAADRPWREIRGKNVIVYGQQSARALRDVAVDIELFRYVLGGLVRGARQPTSVPTLVYLFDNRKSMEPFVPLYRGKPGVMAGYCWCGSPDGSFIALDLESYRDSLRLVFHEYTHLLLSNAAPAVPAWLNEGLAEYYSTFHLKSGNRELNIGEPIAPHVGLLRTQMIPLGELLAVDHSSPLYNEESRRSVFYAEAWALTHMFLMDPAIGASAVNRYVNSIVAGTPSEQALVGAFGMPLKELNERLREYVGRSIFNSTMYRFTERLEVDEPESARTLPPAEAQARLGMVQLAVGRFHEARTRIEAAATLGRDVAQAHLALGLLKLNQKAGDATESLARAAALAPDDFHVQYSLALALLREAISEREDRKTELARDALERAIKVRPASADALAWQAYADLVLGKGLAEARSTITRAIAIAPARLDYRVRLAEICIRMDDLAEARRMLADVASSKGDDSTALYAQTLLNRLNAREKDGRHFVLRNVGPGEKRGYGLLVQVQCDGAGVGFHVEIDKRIAIATAKRMEDVELTTFVDPNDPRLACGVQTPPRPVLITWRISPSADDAVVGEAVALEFVPKGYVP